MTMNRIGSSLSLALAVAALCACLTDKKMAWLFAFLFTFVLFSVLVKIENKLRNSDGEILNKILYYVGKNNQAYVVNYAEIKYRYISKSEMLFEKDLNIRPTKKQLGKYEDKYNWSAYCKDIKLQPKYQEQEIKILGHKNIWNRFEIEFHRRVGKKDTIDTGVVISNLNDELGISQPFLSLVTEEKIKERVMKVIIPPELKSKNAKFEIYPSNNNKKIIKREDLPYDNEVGGYKKENFYPRQGWIYSITWEWEE